MIFFPTNKDSARFIILPVVIWTVLVCSAGYGRGDTDSYRCMVLISMKIRPYVEAVEGIRDVLDRNPEIDPQFFYLEEIQQTWAQDGSFIQERYPHQIIIAIGPEAVDFLISNPPGPEVHQVFSMILNPSSLIPRAGHFCGIYLSVNPDEQLNWIGKTLPDVSTLGILYDPENNADYLLRSQAAALRNKVFIRPLAVTSKNEVADLLRKNWEKIDALLLIPDATIINSTLVKYIIKDGISNNVPVIGYNHFFINSGALMAFVYDYRRIGRQTAEMAAEVMAGNILCEQVPAAFQVVTNNRIAQELDIRIVTQDKSRTLEDE